MLSRRDTNARAMGLREVFETAGAEVVDPPLLQPAETLLDLYGEDVRGRAYITSDALRGEQMLRPDFTVPVVQMHMAHGAEPARYTYAGEVFRRQEDNPDRPSEYVQVGYEVFDRENPAAAEAEVFALISNMLAHAKLRAATGDIGILVAAVAGLKTTDERKAALTRHIWRPRKFRQLLDRYSGKTPTPVTRKDLLADADPLRRAVPLIGKRTLGEIGERITALHNDAAAPPISSGEIELLEALLGIRETVPFALEQLRDVAVDLPAIAPAVDRLADRADAMVERGVDVDRLDFEASYGRTSLEYYDGFVFGFYAERRPDLPPVASGGRYDALTRRLGNGQEIPAVGGVIRPGLLLELEHAQ
ncbi:ATP phosphoribosyltransferase regulatory subunit [Aliishimia ponticola]|uniref:Histidine--tRNA ligase n=1 Tax=Aliishimia ponticola TaxID=2499833 RepID=A0A4S4NAD6_9RHOB|nr:ATP phosphoribosyltransferase regulatory subunit [Aliishimia ponticola]THH36272.1 ATP phosphoribosyltransferase regulatory subunit [Aliishimia ponticola]